jgi:hypothetical protein
LVWRGDGEINKLIQRGVELRPELGRLRARIEKEGDAGLDEVKEVVKASELIDRIERDCSQPNWDSYNAEPIKPEVTRLARQLADRTLLAHFPVSPTVEGGYEWEWDDEAGGTYYVRVNYVPADESTPQISQDPSISDREGNPT